MPGLDDIESAEPRDFITPKLIDRWVSSGRHSNLRTALEPNFYIVLDVAFWSDRQTETHSSTLEYERAIVSGSITEDVDLGLFHSVAC